MASKANLMFTCLSSLIVLTIQLNSVSSVSHQVGVPVSRALLPRATQSNRQGRVRTSLQQHHNNKVLRIRQVAARKLPSTPTGACECMDYWDCVSNNGHVYSYCGISDSEVCCFNKRKDSSSGDNNRNNGLGIIVTSTEPPPSSLFAVQTQTEYFATGNGFSTNDFSTGAIATTTGLPPDVDYFFSLEDGTGDLKRVNGNPARKPSRDDDDDRQIVNGISCGRQDVAWALDSKAQFKEWPWHVALLEARQDLYICGGTLISNDRVITAAHCVNPYTRRRNAARLKVRAGEYDVSTNDEPDPYSEVLVKKITIHPGFNNATLANDIAIVHLATPLNFTSNVQPVCLPYNIGNILEGMLLQSSRSSRQNQCVVAGWGRVTETSPFSITLKEIVVPLWNTRNCEAQLRKNFGTSYKLVESALCAGERGHDACDGDGGGGLVCFDQVQKQWNIVGVVSFGIGCGRQDTPGVYTSIPTFLNWIDNSV